MALGGKPKPSASNTEDFVRMFGSDSVTDILPDGQENNIFKGLDEEFAKMENPSGRQKTKR